MEYVVSFDIGGVFVKAGVNGFRDYLKGKKVDDRYIDYYFRLRQGNVETFCRRFNIDVVEFNEISGRREETEFFEDAHKILSNLQQYNIHIIGISNGISLFDGNLGLFSTYFERIIDSYKVGMLKPDVRMFKLAERYYPEDTIFIHVGDSIYADIIGANRAEWWSVLLDRKNEYSLMDLCGDQKPDYVIGDLCALEGIVRKLKHKKG